MNSNLPVRPSSPTIEFFHIIVLLHTTLPWSCSPLCETLPSTIR
jgi:hypothetical protein